MKKVIVYGTGKNCSILLKNKCIKTIEIVAFVDIKKNGQIYNGRIIIHPNDMKQFDYEEIWITLIDYVEAVEELVEKYGVDAKKVKTVGEINKYCISSLVSQDRMIMISDDTDYLNYPYEPLFACDLIDCVYLLIQGNDRVIFQIKDNTGCIFIIRSHILYRIINNGIWDFLYNTYVNAKKTLLLSDMLGGAFGYQIKFGDIFNIYNLKRDFDLITTYHKSEAEKYGLTHLPQPYYKFQFPSIMKKKYVLFVGNAKDRLEILHKIYGKLTDSGVECKFWINGVDDQDIKEEYSGIIYNQKLKYHEYLYYVQECNCILEMTYQENESSMRYVEAVVYNKKLLANDRGIYERNFFDERYMRVYDEYLEFDYEWINSDIDVNYGYDNSFDPYSYIQLIKSL